LAELRPVCSREDLLAMGQAAAGVTLHPDLRRYIVGLAEATRSQESVALGVSPRGALALARAAQAYALLHSRDYVTPEDIKTLAPSVFCHRLLTRGLGGDPRAILAEILETHPLPTEAMWQ
jgi:MoxR-like ATPase